jgi:putative nucleotidyltransferase with HDIG domain
MSTNKKEAKIFKFPTAKQRAEKTAEIEISLLDDERKKLFEMTARTILHALDCKDHYTYGHSVRVAHYSVLLGKEIGLTEEELYDLEMAALFHDIGKIAIPDAILLKPSRLTEEEFMEMKTHPDKTAEILEEFSHFNLVSKYAKYHHERWDGRGYPEGLKGEDIPLFSRIILLADTFDAMTSSRTYRKGLEDDIAFNEIREFSGSQFDPGLAESFITAIARDRQNSSATFSLTILEGDFDKIAA